MANPLRIVLQKWETYHFEAYDLYNHSSMVSGQLYEAIIVK